MKRLLTAFGSLLLLLAPTVLSARARSWGWCEKGNGTVTMATFTASTKVQRSYPQCTVTVYINGSGGTLATIYSDNSATPLANPFTATTTGYWDFYANDGRYDIQLSGGGLTAPFTFSDVIQYDFNDGFLNGGNTFTTSTAILGTINTLDLLFNTSNTERARITSAGALSISGGPVNINGAPGTLSVNGATTLSSNLTVAGFSAFGGTTINNSTADGYVGIKYDHTFTNYDNEVRGLQSTVRTSRTVVDALWDVFGIDTAVVVNGTNNQHLTGQRKGVVSELYFNAASYLVDTAFNYQANIPTLGSGVTVTNWYGMIVNTPATGGTITNGYGIFIDNLNTGSGTITNPSAIKINGTGDYGRVRWTNTSITESGANLLVGSGLTVGAGGTSGVNAGSVAIGGTTIIDSGANVSTLGYGNFSFLQLANQNAPVASSSGFTRVYAKSDITDPVGLKKLYYKDSANNEYTICTTGTCSGGGGSGVSSLNSLTGAVTLAAGANITLTPVGNTITITSGTGGSGVAGGGTTNTIPKWTNSSTPGTLGDSIVTDTGTALSMVTLASNNAFASGNGNGTSGGGYYVGATQIITGLSGGATASLGNINAIQAIGTITTRGLAGTGAGHFDTLNDGATTATGGYYLSGTKILYGNTNDTVIAAISGLVRSANSFRCRNDSGTYCSVDAGSYNVGGNLLIDTSQNIISSGTISSATGFQINTTATNGHCLVGNGTRYVDNTCGSGGATVVTNTATFGPISNGLFGTHIKLAAGTINANTHSIEIIYGGIYTKNSGSDTSSTSDVYFNVCTVSGCGSGTSLFFAPCGVHAGITYNATLQPYECHSEINILTAGSSGVYAAASGGTMQIVMKTAGFLSGSNMGWSQSCCLNVLNPNIDTTVDQYIEIGASGFAGDQYYLGDYSVKVY